jgi:DNA-binding FrmR family transcriptional regulator
MIAEYKRDAAHRLKGAVGHLKAVEGMVEEERYCIDIMKQLAAVQASLEAVQQILLKNHLSTCVTEAILSGSGEPLIGELVAALRYTKGIPAMEGEAPAGPGSCSHHGTPPGAASPGSAAQGGTPDNRRRAREEEAYG